MTIKLITAILVFALVALPAGPAVVIIPRTKKPEPQFVQILIGCAVLVVAGTFIYHLWKWCKKIPTTPPPDDPPAPGTTNSPPKSNLVGDTVPVMPQVEIIPGESLGYWNVSGYTNQHGYDILMGTTLEVSSDTINWTPRWHFLGWTTSHTNDYSLNVSVFDTNWNRLVSRVGSFTNIMSFTDLPQSPMTGKQEFYRLRKPTKFRP